MSYKCMKIVFFFFLLMVPQFLLRSTDTFVDFQIILTMTTLEFHMNRPTISALMDIGGQLSRSSKSVENMKASEDSKDKSNKAVNGLEPIIVKGLLGKGKARIVSQIQLKLEKSLIFLNLENGSQLAMLEQERIHIDVQVSEWLLFGFSFCLASCHSLVNYCA